MAEERAQKNPKAAGSAPAKVGNASFEVKDGAVLIAAITSCTNTSNPAVLVAAGLSARNALEQGLAVQALGEDFARARFARGHGLPGKSRAAAMIWSSSGFYTVGYGCTTCIGNSGPLKPEISEAVRVGDVVACAVLSGNRNFEGRVHPEIKMNFLASPPLVVAYALAGSLDIDITTEPLGTGKDGKPVYLKDIWPSAEGSGRGGRLIGRLSHVQERLCQCICGRCQLGRSIKTPAGKIYSWDGKSTYVKNPPYFEGMTMTPAPLVDIKGARALAVLGDSVTTDHISPAGNISKTSPAAKYLMAQGVQAADFNSYGARRGNHEVMMRGTFANIRLRNLLLPGTEGGVTLHIPSGEQMSIFDAAMKYKAADTPLVILAGKEYGTGSSRDWAAKGTMLLGVKAVIARKLRAHSPLQSDRHGRAAAAIQGRPERAESRADRQGDLRDRGLDRGAAKTVKVIARADGGKTIEFEARLRIDTPKELDYLPARRDPAVRAAAALAAPGKAA